MAQTTSAISSSVRSGRSSPVARAFDERVHPAVDRAFGGARPTGEPEVHLLEVVDLTMAPSMAPPVG